MFSSPGRTDASRAAGKTQKLALKGLFLDGVWHCNCKPRTPASHFQVKKEGPNRGRWFYTCQERKEDGCQFFLWDTEAAPREMRSVINNSRSEPGAEFKTEADAARDVRANKNTVEGHIAASEEWMAALRKDDEDEYGDWPLTAADMNDLVALDTPTKSDARPGIDLEPSHEVAKKSQAMTPSKRKIADRDSLPTPSTNGKDIFNSPATTRPRDDIFDSYEKPALKSPSVTPTPVRFRDANQAAGLTGCLEYNITTDIMALLAGQNLDEDTTAKLMETLNKHALKMSGITKGRDITRIALKSKDVKISELQQKISALERERDMDKVVIRNLRADITRSVSARRGRGGGRGRGAGPTRES